MIPLAGDNQLEHPLKVWLRSAWFLAAAVAIPATELVRNGSTTSRVGLAVYLSLLVVLLGLQIIVIRIGPSTLRYRLGHEEIIIDTATRPIRVRFEHVVSIALVDGQSLRYRSGLSLKGYHVGTFFGPSGAIAVAASRIQGPGLLVTHWGRLGLGRRPQRLFISPDEPLVAKVLFEEMLAERRHRIHLGQP